MLKFKLIRLSFLILLLASLPHLLPGGNPHDSVAAAPLTGHPLPAQAPEPVIAPELRSALDAPTGEAEIYPVIVTLKEQANVAAFAGLDRATRNRQIVTVLQALANARQAPLRAFLENRQREGTVAGYLPFWVFNGLAVRATGAVIEELALRPEILRITADETISAPVSSTATVVEPNVTQVNAPALWDLGFRGQGIVVASLDSGVYADHPDLSAQWRGGNNSWFDPYGEHPNTPYDAGGHGTQTMGVMVGRDAGGTAIGVAPDAQWIAAKIFDDQGSATTSAIHSAFQWLLDPDANPETADAPHVVNNAWGYQTTGCNLEFQLDLQALRAVGVVPVFSAGNAGPGPDTSVSPANNQEALAVGGVNGADQIYVESSRGPSACDGVTIFPDLVAPAVDIWSSNQYGSYSSNTGTSLAAPHVAGVLALLLSAYGVDLTAAEQEAALLNSAVDLGLSGADNDYGYGRVDALAAFNVLQGGTPPPTPTPTATATSTPTPAPTATPLPLTNVALNRPVSVSSAADVDHSGEMAVDGDLLTLWQTKKAVGKKVLASEWLVVDLGAGVTISEVELVWDVYYATDYTIQIADDNENWDTVVGTTSGDGGQDTFVFAPVTARYVKLNSTGWLDASLRNWLQEFSVYGQTDDSQPTATATASPTLFPSPTPTSTPAAQTTLHVGDLDGTSTPARNRWDATVSILIHDGGAVPMANVTVSGNWDGGAAGDGSCLTDSTGHCEITLSRLRTTVIGVTFAVTDVVHPVGIYHAAENHDPDGDSDGTTIAIQQP